MVAGRTEGDRNGRGAAGHGRSAREVGPGKSDPRARGPEVGRGDRPQDAAGRQNGGKGTTAAETAGRVVSL